MKRLTIDKRGMSDKTFDLIVRFILLIVVLICVYPVYFVLIASVSDFNAVNSGRFLLFPVGFHVSGYKFVFSNKDILSGYMNTLIYTVGGTVLGLVVSFSAGYSLSRRDLVGRGLIMKLMIFTMYFSGGLIPTYLVAKGLNLTNTRLIIILLDAVSVYNIILIRNFCEGNLSDELLDAAKIDGCGNLKYFYKFAVPLSKAIIAVIALYLAVAYWNSYYTSLVYLTDVSKKPLQLVIREMLMSANNAASIADGELAGQYMRELQVVRYAVIVCATAPIMCVYPFIQKYFVKGVMMGSVKG